MAESSTKGKQPTKDPRNYNNKTEGIPGNVTISDGNLSDDNLNLGTQSGGVTINTNAKGNNNEGGRRNHRKQHIKDPKARNNNKAEGKSNGKLSGDNLNLGTQSGGVRINANAKGNNNEGGRRNHRKLPIEKNNKTEGVLSTVSVTGCHMSGDNLNLDTQTAGWCDDQ